MTTAIALETSKGNLQLAIGLGMVLLRSWWRSTRWPGWSGGPPSVGQDEHGRRRFADPVRGRHRGRRFGHHARPCDAHPLAGPPNRVDRPERLGLIGPKTDPAGIRDGKDIVAALKTLKDKQAAFISRGDRSGTHIAELNLWKLAGIDIAAEGRRHKEIGQGMRAALNTASAADAYVLSDRATWLSFKNKGDLVVVVQGDKRLFNQYGVMLVNPVRHPTVKRNSASSSSIG